MRARQKLTTIPTGRLPRSRCGLGDITPDYKLWFILTSWEAKYKLYWLSSMIPPKVTGTPSTPPNTLKHADWITQFVNTYICDHSDRPIQFYYYVFLENFYYTDQFKNSSVYRRSDWPDQFNCTAFFDSSYWGDTIDSSTLLKHSHCIVYLDLLPNQNQADFENQSKFEGIGLDLKTSPNGEKPVQFMIIFPNHIKVYQN